MKVYVVICEYYDGVDDGGSVDRYTNIEKVFVGVGAKAAAENFTASKKNDWGTYEVKEYDAEVIDEDL